MANQKKYQKEHKRRYISLFGDGKGEEVCPDEFFEDEDDFGYYDDETIFAEDEVKDDGTYGEKIDRIISEIPFIALFVAGILAVCGAAVLVYRFILYPFIKLFAKDCDW